MQLLLANAAIPYLVTLGVSLALSAAAYFLLKPKAAKSPGGNTKAQDVDVTNVSVQGAYVPLLIGRRRIGAVIAWVGDRGVTQGKTYSAGDAKGSRGRRRTVISTVDVYSERAWHLLCVGPAKKLHRIWSDGVLIFDQEVTSDATPSGSFLTATTGELFSIHWGEVDQPVNTFLGDAARVGIASRWPHVCYVVWFGKQLGTSPRWPQLDYEIEVESQYGDFALTDCAPANAVPTSSWDDAGEAAIGTGTVLAELVGETGPSSAFDEATFTIPTSGYYRIFQDNGAGIDLNLQLGHEPASFSPTATWQRFKVSLDGETMWELTDFGIIEDPSPFACWPYSEIPGGGGLRRYSIDEPEIEDQIVYLSAGDHTLRVDIEVTEDGTSGSNESYGQARLYFKRVENVVSPNGFVGVLGQILFEEYPHGLGFNEDLVDVSWLTSTSTQLDSEGLDEFSVLAVEGEEAVNVVGPLLQDAGVLWVHDYNYDNGESFYRVREEAAPLPTIPEGVVLPSETEIEILHIEKPVDRVMYSFSDLARNYRETVIAIDAAGQQSEAGNVRGAVARIGTVVDYQRAAVIAERRSQEELGGGARFTVFAGRDTRRLIPGMAIEVAGIPYVLRVVEVRLDPLTSKTQIDCILDHYGAPATTFEQPEDSVDSGGSSAAPLANLAQTWIEIPEHVAGFGAVNVAGVRLRAHDDVSQQLIHFSADGSTYKPIGTDTARMAGGTLTEAIAADDSFLIEDGPTFDALGPDIDDVQDLSADEAAWKRGDQLCLIGEELFHLRGIVALGGSSYRLSGLIRARYDTERAVHAIGAAVFIFPESGLVPFQDALAFPGVDLHVKQQPVAASALDLASVTAVTKTVEGKGVVPMKPSSLRVVLPHLCVAAYAAGDDVRFAWGYRSSATPGTGRGMHPAGVRVGSSPIRGQFEVRIYDAGNVLVRTELVAVPSFNYDNATLQADLGGETDFRIEVRNVDGGYRSDPVELDVEAL